MRYASKVTSVSTAMNANAPTVGAFVREKGKPFTEGLIMAWLAYLNSMLNLRRPMSDEQIELCAVSVVEEFASLKISDVTYIFKKIMNGEYGEFYESISMAKVLTFFRDYFNERCEIAEQESMRAHMDNKSKDTFNFSSNTRRIYEGSSEGFNSETKWKK